jgi:hypothetical protein
MTCMSLARRGRVDVDGLVSIELTNMENELWTVESFNSCTGTINS